MDPIKIFEAEDNLTCRTVIPTTEQHGSGAVLLLRLKDHTTIAIVKSMLL